jgi:hypothetical protein
MESGRGEVVYHRHLNLPHLPFLFSNAFMLSESFLDIMSLENPAEKKYFFSTEEKRLKKLLFTKRSLQRG